MPECIGRVHGRASRVCGHASRAHRRAVSRAGHGVARTGAGRGLVGASRVAHVFCLAWGGSTADRAEQSGQERGSIRAGARSDPGKSGQGRSAGGRWWSDQGR